MLTYIFEIVDQFIQMNIAVAVAHLLTSFQTGAHIA